MIHPNLTLGNFSQFRGIGFKENGTLGDFRDSRVSQTACGVRIRGGLGFRVLYGQS